MYLQLLIITSGYYQTMIQGKLLSNYFYLQSSHTSGEVKHGKLFHPGAFDRRKTNATMTVAWTIKFFGSLDGCRSGKDCSKKETQYNLIHTHLG